MYIACVDESYEEDPDGMFVMSACVSTHERWEKFKTEWQDGLRRYNASSPLHMTELINRWTLQYQAEIFGYFYNTIFTNSEFLCYIAVQRGDLRKILNDVSEGKLKDPLNFCIGALIGEITHGVEFHGSGDMVEFIFDECREVEVIEKWQNFIEEAPPYAQRRIYRKPEFRSDKLYMPLQAADFRAFSALKAITRPEWPQPWRDGRKPGLKTKHVIYTPDKLMEYRDKQLEYERNKRS